MMLRIAALAVAQLALVAGAVAPQLISRVTGEDYLLRVEPLDPIDPFRGAYVTLAYPDLQGAGGPSTEDDESWDVYVELVEEDGFWVAGGRSSSRPESGPYLACVDRGWELSCGIESYFVPQDRALDLERGLADGGGVAVVRIDSRGVGSVISVEAE